MNWCDDVPFPKRCRPLPAGYKIIQLDSGHFLWTLGENTEGAISWDRWWVRRCAFAHHAESIAIALVVGLRLLSIGGAP